MKQKQLPLVLIDAERTKYNYVGLFTYCTTLIKAINSSNEPKKFSLACYAPKSVRFFFQSKNEIFCQHILHKFFFPCLLLSPNLNRIKIFHSTYQFSNYFPFISNKWKVILTIHDFNFLIEKKEYKKKRLLANIKKKINRAEKVIFISDYVFNQALSFWGYSPKYCRIYNGVDENKESLPCTQPPQINTKKPFLLALGTVLPKKNFISILPIIKNNDYEIIIAGKKNKSYVQKIKEYAVNLGIDNRVHLIGTVTEEEKKWLYINCKAFLFPSIAEGFGLPVIEAMSFGKPCFLSTHCSLPEVGGKHAYYFQDFSPKNMQTVFAEGMKDYLANENERIIEIKNWAKNFSIDKQATAYIQLYNQLLTTPIVDKDQ